MTVPTPSDAAIAAYLAAFDADLHAAGPRGVDRQYDTLRRWLGAAYAVDLAALRAPAAPTGTEDDEGVCMDCGGPLGNDERGKGFPHHVCCLCGGLCTDPVNHLSLPDETACALQPANPDYAPCTRRKGHEGPCAHPPAPARTPHSEEGA